MLRSQSFCSIAIFIVIMTIDVCEARGRAPARARARIPGVRYPGGNGAGSEGKEFYRTANIWSLAWGFQLCQLSAKCRKAKRKHGNIYKILFCRYPRLELGKIWICYGTLIWHVICWLYLMDYRYLSPAIPLPGCVLLKQEKLKSLYFNLSFN